MGEFAGLPGTVKNAGWQPALRGFRRSDGDFGFGAERQKSRREASGTRAWHD